jgi:hypothetical protein
MPAPSAALRSISVEGYLRKDDVVNLRKGCEGLVRWLRKIEQPKAPRWGRWFDGEGDAVMFLASRWTGV